MRRMLWSGVVFLSLIMIAAAVRRMLNLSPPSGNFDAAFGRHPVLTVTHIIPGLLFIVLGPFQFFSGLRRRHPSFHRWNGRVFLVSASIVGVTALVMGPQMAIGGPLETAATLVFGSLFLFSLAAGFLEARARRFADHRRWMIRGYAIGLAVATVRPINGVFFATRRLTGLTPHDFFGIAFWLGFSLSLAAAELWIRSTTVAGRMRAR